MKILIIGAGNMGTTFGASFVQSNLISPDHLYFMDHLPEKAAGIAALSRHELALEPGAWVTDMDLVILGVKPQDFPHLAQQLRTYLRPDQLLLSIMAGISIAAIQAKLGVEKVVRAMPNLPAQVGQGMTVFSTADAVTRIESYTVQNLLNTTGKTIFTEDEGQINAATAVSGSGPAYVFYFMNAMIQAALNMGFNQAEAHLLVRQTCEGALDLLSKGSLSSQEWIKRVSSRGGTTEAAIQSFDQQQLAQIIQTGMEAARLRAVELSK